jgi:hypothetical protein
MTNFEGPVGDDRAFWHSSHAETGRAGEKRHDICMENTDRGANVASSSWAEPAGRC